MDSSAESTPFAEDTIITDAAERVGMEVTRSRSIVVTDRKALDAVGLIKKSPDMYRIRQLLNDGADVPGAHFGPVEYRLTRRADGSEQA